VASALVNAREEAAAAEATRSRNEVLGRIRTALGPQPAVPDVPREYRQAGAADRGAADVVELFCERVADYRAVVVRTTPDNLAAAIAAACEARGSRRLIAAPGVDWPVPGVEVKADGAGVAVAELDAASALSGCALAIAETGTIVLDASPACGRRALTLVPDHHVCVVRADQVVAGVPDAIAALAPAAREGRPITFVSGPSATSDIELERVEGVHGPRKLDVIVVA
jgi:L-lactate dehydrogenase complex protein LldG